MFGNKSKSVDINTIVNFPQSTDNGSGDYTYSGGVVTLVNPGTYLASYTLTAQADVATGNYYSQLVDVTAGPPGTPIQTAGIEVSTLDSNFILTGQAVILRSLSTKK